MEFLIITGMYGRRQKSLRKILRRYWLFLCGQPSAITYSEICRDVCLQGQKSKMDKIALIMDIYGGGTLFLELFPALESLAYGISHIKSCSWKQVTMFW